LLALSAAFDELTGDPALRLMVYQLAYICRAAAVPAE